MRSEWKTHSSKFQPSDFTKRLYMAQRPFWLILICFWFVGHARCSAQGQPGYLAPGGGTSPGLIVSSSVGRYVTFNWGATTGTASYRSEEHTSELQSLRHLVCRLLLEK